MKFIMVLGLIGIASCVSRETAVERQMIGLIEKFDRYDYDGNGNLTATELVEAEKISGIPTPEIIRFYDKNGNGKISLIEVQAGMSRLNEAQTEVTKKSDLGYE